MQLPRWCIKWNLMLGLLLRARGWLCPQSFFKVELFPAQERQRFGIVFEEGDYREI
jgi:hypothetical protein